MSTPRVLWTPAPDARAHTRIGAFMARVERNHAQSFDGYDDLLRWSLEDLEGFWRSVWEHFEVGPDPGVALAEAGMPGARWFPDARLNWAERLLRLDGRDPDEVVVVARSEARERADLTGTELRDAVARVRAGLVRLGVGPGDRVAAYLPNIPEAVVALLATASLGAVWTSCAPEFGTRGVIDRLAQVEPKVLLTIDGYRYGGRAVDRRAEVAEILAALPSVTATVVLPYVGSSAAIVPHALSWADLTAEAGELAFASVPFDHPLFVLYSSGTTGLPKPIIHGHGGILLEHLKVLGLQQDLGPSDRFFWYSTTGWMMWNYLVSGLAVGATIVLLDGSPAYPDLGSLWRMAAEERVTYFGTSAPYLMVCRRRGLRPRDAADLSALRAIGSTGAPLPAEGFRWVHEAVGASVHLESLSGGTDVCTAFVGASPLVPVWEGEISCRALGAAVEAFGPDGLPAAVGDQGELVITRPMPSMPVGFWNDPTGERYRDAYFGTWPGVWRHGDWITFTPRGSCVITGRSDATLNRGGVRIGTAEVYGVVEGLPEVADSLVVHLDATDRLLLFVVLNDAEPLTDAFRARIKAELRGALSPRHVPDEVIAVRAVPRTLSGKKLEVPVKRILGGAAADEVASRGSLADPTALDDFVALADTLR